MYFLLTIIFAATAAVVQSAFLSRLPIPFSSLEIPVIAIALAVAAGRPLTAALWALFGGLMLDLHGVFGFGAEAAALFAGFGLAHVLFGRFVSNTSGVSVFVLAVATGLARMAVLSILDGLRLLFAGDAVLFTGGLEPLGPMLIAVVVAGGAAAFLSSVSGAVHRRLDRAFLTAPVRLR